ncbi:sulfite exporter TauE/SafE family protein [Candidatus Electronema sp. PJ]|uniref:sulfite exporter TauE/SafE family protein n=1 Tax=Candidatus Electronema sp. PJ TaxID=3401572 RepID=UPI003AA930C7
MTDLLFVTFPASGVQTWVFLPPLTAFIVSFFTSMGGLSGAFLLLPFQMSILHYTAPSVSATNQLFNVVAIPSGVWRYTKERRMVWPLTAAVIIGTLPGVLIGAWVRLEYLPDPKQFKLFAGLVLLYVGSKFLTDLLRKTAATNQSKAPTQPAEFVVTDSRFSLKRAAFSFAGEQFSFSVPKIFLLTFVVGIIGGIYGIGGGAIIAPFMVAFFRLPVYAVAGASLMGTFITSVAGVGIYQLLAVFYPNQSVAPDWQLGFLFGMGGFCGMYLGARCQKHLPARAIKMLLCFFLFFTAMNYIVEWLR